MNKLVKRILVVFFVLILSGAVLLSIGFMSKQVRMLRSENLDLQNRLNLIENKAEDETYTAQTLSNDVISAESIESSSMESETELLVSVETESSPVTLDETKDIKDIKDNQSLPDLVDDITQVIVSIECTAKEEYFIGSSKQISNVQSSGTGIVITSDGYIATCWHVVDGADTIDVILHDGTRYTATLTGKDERFDLAVIHIKANSLQTATIGDSDSLRSGETMIAIGNAMGVFSNSVSVGVLSAPTRTITINDIPMKLLQTDTAVNPGNSGGGLFNTDGKLIGIVNAKISSSEIEGISFAIPINSVIKKIDDIINHGYVLSAAYIGLSTANDRYYDNKTLQYVECIKITKIDNNSPAQNAGLKVGDYITTVNDQTIADNDDFSLIIYYSEVGDLLTVTVFRNKSLITVDVTLAKK